MIELTEIELYNYVAVIEVVATRVVSNGEVFLESLIFFMRSSFFTCEAARPRGRVVTRLSASEEEKGGRRRPRFASHM